MRKGERVPNSKNAILWSIPGFVLLMIGTVWFLLGDRGGIEDGILEWIGGIRGPLINGLFMGVTLSGNFAFTLPLTILFLLALASSGRKRLSLKLSLAGVILILLTLFLKVITSRERPEEITWMVDPYGESFPSGHCIVAVSLYGAIMMTLGSIRPEWSGVLFAAWFLFSLLMGASRIFMGVHYPSDVVAGLGISYAAFPFLHMMIRRDLVHRRKEKEE
ncbi:MAG: phosphatase PAP2 family protein [Candidatus Thermoplasmatota archaeon]|nr:phosphatase PAP2 family protein [Candidatus Thermoplasmatota archaeon]